MSRYGERIRLTNFAASAITANWMGNDYVDAGSARISQAVIYSSYSGGLRSANYTVQYSSNGSSWTTAFSGVATNNSACGLIVNSGGGSDYGLFRYWRYVEGSAIVNHHPRIARLVLRSTTGVDFNIKVYAADNCADSGEITIGTVAYDFLLNTNI
jgi:hypothetical protein